MKAPARTSVAFFVLVMVSVCWAGGDSLVGQTLRVLHSFADGRSEGWGPIAPVVLSANTLYGTTMWGGASNAGTVFRITTDGTDFETLHQFTAGTDGGVPQAGMVLSADTLYGTTLSSVFAIKTNGSGFRVLHNFVPSTIANTNLDGYYLVGGLVLSGTTPTLYGTTSQQGATGDGTIFKVNTDGTGFATLYNFSAADGFINADGAVPYGRLVLSAGTLYGTTYWGGSGGNGTVFAVNIDGSGFKTLYSFAEGGNWQFHNFTNDGGSNPHAGLVLLGDTLYGTTEYGGNGEGGTVYKIKTDGTAFGTVHDLVLAYGHPYGGLALSGSTLYGAAGEVFAVNIDGSSYTQLFPFTNFITGLSPSELIQAGVTLYGVTSAGGLLSGTIFSLSVAPQLSVVQAGGDTILSWPTNYAGFDYTKYSLQATTNLASPTWAQLGLPARIINGENVVTNPASGTRQFFRLIQ